MSTTTLEDTPDSSAEFAPAGASALARRPPAARLETLGALAVMTGKVSPRRAAPLRLGRARLPDRVPGRALAAHRPAHGHLRRPRHLPPVRLLPRALRRPVHRGPASSCSRSSASWPRCSPPSPSARASALASPPSSARWPSPSRSTPSARSAPIRSASSWCRACSPACSCCPRSPRSPTSSASSPARSSSNAQYDIAFGHVLPGRARHA